MALGGVEMGDGFQEPDDERDDLASYEPINLFSRRIDPRGVVEVLRSRGWPIVVTGPEDDWSEITVDAPLSAVGRCGAPLLLGHRAKYYDGEDWPRLVLGMQGYFSRFPETPNKLEIMRLIGSFQFALVVRSYDLNIDGDDERLEVLYRICAHLDGVLFTPSSLRDARGRVLYGSDGTFDPQAVMPMLPPMEEPPDSPAELEEYVPPVPLTAERVARRALALTAVAARAWYEIDWTLVIRAEAKRQRILRWLDDLGLGEELEPDEWKVLQRPMGRMEPQDHINAMWRIEGLVVLAWALNLCSLPPDDAIVVPRPLFKKLGLWKPELAKEILVRPRLRSAEELAAMQTHLLMFHWRMRNYQLRPVAMDFREFSKDCWVGSFDISWFRLVENDLAIGKKPIHRAKEEDRRRVHSAAMERHLAINWVMGYSEVYSATDTST